MKHALRSLARTPGFTIVAITTLALGIGLTTAMFSLLNTFLLRPLPYPASDRLIELERTSVERSYGRHAPATAIALAELAADVAQIAYTRSWGFTIAESGKPAEVVGSARVSPAYFDVLGVQPMLGRLFRPEEDAPGANHVVILSNGLWQSRYGGDPSVVGRVVRIDGEPAEIVGVLPASAGSLAAAQAELYRPLGLTPEERASFSELTYRVLGRLHAGVSIKQAQARLDAIAAQLVVDHPQENAGLGIRVVSLQSTALRGTGRNLTYLLLGLSAFVLLIACANLANLLLVRAVARGREFAIRAALGAGRSQLIRPLIAECVLLALAGAGLGLLVSSWTTDLMESRLGGGDGTLEFALDWRVAGFTLGAALLTALLFGLAPAWLAAHVPIVDTLKRGARGSTADRSQQRLRQSLIVGQFTLALVLLAGAGVFVRGIDQLLRRDAGWEPRLLISGKISLPDALAREPARSMQFYLQVQERLAALPGAAAASVDLDLPTFDFTGARPYAVEGHASAPAGRELTADTNAVSPQYFSTVGTRVLRGRAVTSADRLTSPPVVLINEAMARQVFPGEDPIGRRIGQVVNGQPMWAEIVGVVEDVRFLNVAGPTTPFQVYKPLSQETWGFVSITVRAASEGAVPGLVDAIRRTVSELNPDLPVLGLAPMPKAIERSVSDLRMITQLLLVFAGLGLFLAALGVYSVIARLVLQRTGEIGVRIALGAQFGDIMRLILGNGLRLAVVGTALGLLGAAGLSHFLTTTMPEIAHGAALMIGLAAATLLVTALLACYLPARRATKVDPLTALRAD